MNPYLKLIRFDKPIGTMLILWPTLSALLVAYQYHPPVLIVLVFILEAFLTRSFGCAINDFSEVLELYREYSFRQKPVYYYY